MASPQSADIDAFFRIYTQPRAEFDKHILLLDLRDAQKHFKKVRRLLLTGLGK